MCNNNTTANSAQEETSFTCNDNDDDDCLWGVVNYETKFAGRKGRAFMNEGEDCLRRDNVDDSSVEFNSSCTIAGTCKSATREQIVPQFKSYILLYVSTANTFGVKFL